MMSSGDEPMVSSGENSSEATEDPLWSIVRTIGEGAYGEVKLIQNREGTMCFAMKCIKADNQRAVHQMKKEDMLHRKAKGHANIVDCFGMRFDHHEVQLFLEYCSYGELFDQIEPDVGMEEYRAHIFLQNIVSGIKHLHALGIAHRDIKPENLFLTSRNWLKIGDFGLATLFKNPQGQERLLESRCGTVPYGAPEVMDESIAHYRGPPNDIWSAGIVLVAMMVGELPWEEPNREHDAYREFMDDYEPTAQPWCRMPEKVLALVRKILVEDPNRRATIVEIEVDDWYANYKPIERKPREVVAPQEDIVKAEDVPETKKSRVLSANISSSQPTIRTEDKENNAQFRAAARAYHGFSQPADIKEIFLSGSQTLSQLDNLQHLVRRMTRFCVIVPLEEAIKKFEDVVKSFGYQCHTKFSNQMVVSGSNLTFIVTVHSTVDRVFIDCRRSRGDGLAFKRVFMNVRNALSDIIDDSCARHLPIMDALPPELVSPILHYMSKESLQNLGQLDFSWSPSVKVVLSTRCDIFLRVAYASNSKTLHYSIWKHYLD
ncbi:hypothetical protein QR680_005065 [Steinernema hermaphroditum]|uniref:non-specific serine/threonine protein kinase n=1 Tax=Steinernema hermaphroditum TaxID=289476 RepID=A0AA39HRT3_9BILA|nr:hypothetical protein QR680_005065 [Steinernema hermaphroditum]